MFWRNLKQKDSDKNVKYFFTCIWNLWAFFDFFHGSGFGFCLDPFVKQKVRSISGQKDPDPKQRLKSWRGPHIT